MKKILIAITGLLGIGGTAIAAPYSGFYFGPEVGVDQDRMQVHYEDATGVNPSRDADGIGYNGMNYGLFGGYQTRIGNSVLGLEITSEGSTAKYSDTNFVSGTGVAVAVKDKWSYGLSGRLGYLIQNALLYGRLGWVRTRFDVNSNNGFSAHNDLDGFRYGVGIETGLTRTLSLRGEYTLTNYENWTVQNGTDSLRVSPDKGQFKVGLAYHY